MQQSGVSENRHIIVMMAKSWGLKMRHDVLVRNITSGTGFFAAGVTLVLFGTGSRLTSFELGPLTLSAWITAVISICFAAILFVTVFTVARRLGTRLFARRLRSIGLAPWLMMVFASYALLSLAIHWRYEGAQNVLSFGLFALGAFAWALTFRERRNSLTWDLVVYVVMGHSVFVMLTNLVGWNVIDQRSFAMTAVVGLAAAVVVPGRNMFLRFAPYVIFLSIVLSSSRTATIAALVMIGFVAFRTASRGLRRVTGFILAYVVALLSIFVVYSLYPPAKGRLIAGDEAIRIPALSPLNLGNSSGKSQEPVPALVINSNGRLEAWSEFIDLLHTPFDWVFGLGTGASAEYGGKNLTHFSQVLNEYLRILIDNGVVGLLLFLLAMVGLIVTLSRSNQIPWQYRVGALLVLFALSIVSFTDGAFIYPFSALPAALLVGLALSWHFRAKGISLESLAPEDFEERIWLKS